MKIRALITLVVIIVLPACAGREYVDNAELEKPPAMVLSGSTASSQEPITAESSPETKPDKGLGNAVSISQDAPRQLMLKRNFDMAWNDVEQALKQLNIEITDREHDKKQYYVTFDADDYQPEDSGFLEKSTSFFRNDYQVAVYTLTFSEYSDETVITAELANSSEQTSRGYLQDGTSDNNLTDGSDRLLLSLYKGLRDTVVEE